jgi:beta-glucosidase
MGVKYPDNFLWGAATSAFQVEGHIENDMTDWERAGRFRQDGRDPRIGDAVDHWHRWREDFQLLADLGLNAYRFSIEWSRVEPKPGQFDDAAIEQYAEMIAWLRTHGITPMITLHHFSHPAWFHDLCPWHMPDSVIYFERFVKQIASRLLVDMPLIVTFNEPLVWLLAGYGDAKFPPGEKNLSRLMRGLHHMLQAHRQAYDLIKRLSPDSQIGIAHNFIVFKRARPGHPIDGGLKRLIHYFYNLMIPEAFQTNRLEFRFPLLVNYNASIQLDDRIDFWGINYYYRLHVKFRFDLRRPFELIFKPRSGEGLSDLGWELYSKGLRKACEWLAPAGKPIYITESGIATEDDTIRVAFLKSHLAMLEQIIKDGHMVKGYFYWSLLDNYEWLVGHDARFGLYHVDYSGGLERTRKASASFLQDHIRQTLPEID